MAATTSQTSDSPDLPSVAHARHGAVDYWSRNFPDPHAGAEGLARRLGNGYTVTFEQPRPAGDPPGPLRSWWLTLPTARTETGAPPERERPPTMSYPASLVHLLAATLLAGAAAPAAAAVTTPHPIVFVTQVPVPGDFTTIGSTFGNHQSTQRSAARGGDLWIRYPDGTLRNLSAAAGLGQAGLQGDRAIAVRDPSPHWDGRKLVFSAVVGAPTRQFIEPETRWQLYEITGLGANDTPVVTRVPNQPEGFNNISPVYGSDDRILFTSDRPRNGAAHLYPQLDEYEEAPTVTGIWSLDPRNGDLFLLNHAPSGAFTPQLDSFGRVIFTRWDHLQRDQQADADRAGSASYGTFNFSDESAAARALTDRSEVFPETRDGSGSVSGHRFNQFFPWQINEDGTEEETLNHIGRHELSGYGTQSFLDDANLRECCDTGSRFNRFTLTNDSLL